MLKNLVYCHFDSSCFEMYLGMNQELPSEKCKLKYVKIYLYHVDQSENVKLVMLNLLQCRVFSD